MKLEVLIVRIIRNDTCRRHYMCFLFEGEKLSHRREFSFPAYDYVEKLSGEDHEAKDRWQVHLEARTEPSTAPLEHPVIEVDPEQQTMTVNKAAEAISRKLMMRRGGNGDYVDIDRAACYLSDTAKSTKKLTGSQRRSVASTMTSSHAFGEDIKTAFFHSASLDDADQACPAPPTLERASTLGSATTTLESVIVRRKNRGRLHQELLRYTNTSANKPSEEPVEDGIQSSLRPSTVITVTKSRRNLMRQVSALGMGGALATGGMVSPKRSSPIFDGMRVDAVPEGMQELFSVCSDPTAEPGDGLDTTLYHINLGTRHPTDESRQQGGRLRHGERDNRPRPSEHLLWDDTDTISTCSMDEGGHVELSAATLGQQRTKHKATGGLLLHAYDDDGEESIDLEDHCDDEESFDVVQQESKHDQLGSVSRSGCRNARNVKSTVDKMHDSQQLIMEAALACRDGTAWCAKSLAHEALEQSFSHLSRVSLPRW
jgi:hypothetical protein